ncbi:MAG: DCC1-like thiol-disulfide oxidoreductase family protein [Pacificimonas sp.]|jgi:predicted DCC family thiol-disulfide oxidoreductase YuxK|nr:DCC1-like thiol-disulfide oxidoreductase family protein [Pacificimonas sp.]
MAEQSERAGAEEPIVIVYDGDCPFCTAYVKMARLKKAVGPVELVDAREPHPVVAEIEALGLDLDEGMAMKLDGEILHGDEVVHRLSLMTTPNAGLNGLAAKILKDRRRAKLLYPWLRAGRNLALALLGKRKIGAAKKDGGTERPAA